MPIPSEEVQKHRRESQLGTKNGGKSRSSPPAKKETELVKEATLPGSDSEESLQEFEQEPAEFFDPDLDEEDAAWVERQRQGRRTDAVLSCPCCLTTCCIDCQQHEDRPDQYRAMFVTNCRVDFSETLMISSKTEGSRKRQRGKGQIQSTSLEEAFHPVYCSLCSTKLGVYDSEEVFHFLNCVASEA